jgi:hypothetical protein
MGTFLKGIALIILVKFAVAGWVILYHLFIAMMDSL